METEFRVHEGDHTCK